MSRGLDVRKAEAALTRAGRRAVHGTIEERSGRIVSSVIKDFEYDEKNRELDVTFTSGKTYRYKKVPLDICVGFFEAGSKGQYFNSRIRDDFVFSEVSKRSRHKSD